MTNLRGEGRDGGDWESWASTSAEIAGLPETDDDDLMKIKRLMVRIAVTNRQMAVLGKGLAEVSEAHEKNIALLKRANEIQIGIVEELIKRVDRLERKLGP